MEEQVRKTIDAIRPAIQADGGDIFLRGVDDGHRRGHGRARRRLRELPGLHRDAEGRRRAHPQGPRRGRHRGRGRRRARARAPSRSSSAYSACVMVWCRVGGAGPRGAGRRPPRAGDRRALARAPQPHRAGWRRRPRGRPADLSRTAVGRTRSASPARPASGKSTLTNAPDRRHAGAPGDAVGGAGHRPVVAVLGRGDPRRPGPHERPRPRRRRVHPLDGHPRPPRRARARPRPRPSGCSTPSGLPWVLIETVGVGQVEVEVAGAADTTVVVVNPGWGDAVQANKAGPAWRSPTCSWSTRPTAPAPPRPAATSSACSTSPRARRRRLAAARSWPPSATTGEGVDELWRPIGEHRAHLEADGRLAGAARRAAARGAAR